MDGFGEIQPYFLFLVALYSDSSEALILLPSENFLNMHKNEGTRFSLLSKSEM